MPTSTPFLAPCVPPDLYEFAKEIVIQVRADAMLRDGRLTADQGGPRHGDLIIEEAWHRCEREGRLPKAYLAFVQPDTRIAHTAPVIVMSTPQVQAGRADQEHVQGQTSDESRDATSPAPSTTTTTLAELLYESFREQRPDPLAWAPWHLMSESERMPFFRQADWLVERGFRTPRAFADVLGALNELRSLLDTPEVEDFDKAVPLEAAHQVQRWGTAHDDGKAPEDWFWLVGYLAGKALAAWRAGDLDKAKHHCVSAAAALRNWHAHVRSGSSTMRPGVEAPKG